MHPKTRNILYKLRLTRIFHGVFLKATPGVLELLQKVEPYVTYGYPNVKNVSDLIYKKGYGKIDNKRVPLIDNNIIEQVLDESCYSCVWFCSAYGISSHFYFFSFWQALGKHGIVCIEDIVHEVVNAGPHFKEISSFLGSFSLNKPKEGLMGKKALYIDGGDTGNRENQINDLINKMN
ncbi:hypothetical protein NC652_000576 [Populus alba x Populus x berolinensis]|uniref:Large ribosomal subunit protein uL30-like ferredoxin-like fold domain-containing protein n=1 Tax=Populus alba x Populus x berolinensis TaxID=444605 RepID=A0AAD6RK20_9ROSI|nr:hypothetical protein NC652_000576 [Populus alba x Populus x berolinensis]KAJ7009926.1 hypothetical protein NC653_000592 [Populus alba x Populus x berolinensis]